MLLVSVILYRSCIRCYCAPSLECRDRHEASQVAGQSHQYNQPGTADLRKIIANGISPSPKKTLPPNTQTRKRRTRPLADIIWENQLFYNDFIKNKVPRLLYQLDVEKSSNESN
jgi:hypothetical protein